MASRYDLAENHRGNESGHQDAGHGTNILDADSNPDRDADYWIALRSRDQSLRSGPTLEGLLQRVGISIERALADLPNTRSAFAERATGGYFLDFTVNREAAARCGLLVEDVNQIVEIAIGGNTIGATVDGRERYPISVRYAREFRDNIDALNRVLVATPAGNQVPISLLADISYRSGPPDIRDENGQLVSYVFLDITGTDINGYVQAASKRIGQRVQFPPGYYFQWTGQFQYLQAAEKRLAVLIPFTLLIIFVLVYLNTRSLTKTFIVLLTVPFSLTGAFWFVYLLGYNMSVAVWIGLIALAGLDAETGVVMLLYLDLSWAKFRAEGRMNSLSDLYLSVREGAVQRIRPKMMAVCAILFGLLPIMWSPDYQAGADIMKRIAAPMIGGVITSAVLNLLIYPVIYVKCVAQAPFAKPESVTQERIQNSEFRRQETGDRRQETGDRRQETGDRRQETGDRRQETGSILRSHRE